MSSNVREKCLKCGIYKREMESSGSCCKYFMDNVVCGDEKDTSNCDQFEELTDEE